LNALAPGAIMTPLLKEQLSTPGQAKAVRSFPVPIGGFGDVRHMADWMCFMLSDSADFLCGSVVFVDGAPMRISRPTTGRRRSRRIGCSVISAGSGE
jgi:NAD(P)-dependent dehydrogenase (short-subunit alcohol dehydrogenase family)